MFWSNLLKITGWNEHVRYLIITHYSDLLTSDETSFDIMTIGVPSSNSHSAVRKAVWLWTNTSSAISLHQPCAGTTSNSARGEGPFVG